MTYELWYKEAENFIGLDAVFNDNRVRQRGQRKLNIVRYVEGDSGDSTVKG